MLIARIRREQQQRAAALSALAPEFDPEFSSWFGLIELGKDRFVIQTEVRDDDLGKKLFTRFFLVDPDKQLLGRVFDAPEVRECSHTLGEAQRLAVTGLQRALRRKSAYALYLELASQDPTGRQQGGVIEGELVLEDTSGAVVDDPRDRRVRTAMELLSACVVSATPGASSLRDWFTRHRPGKPWTLVAEGWRARAEIRVTHAALEGTVTFVDRAAAALWDLGHMDPENNQYVEFSVVTAQ